MKYLMLMLILLAACSDTPRLASLPADATVLAFGDSLTYGTGAGDKETYPAVLQELIGRTVINDGVPGEVTAEGLARLPAALDQYAPRLLILCHGGNDFLRSMGEKQAADNIRAMVMLARSRGIGVVLVGVPKFGITLSPPDFYAALAEELVLPYDGEVIRQILLNNEQKSDEIHPNAKGYRVMAETLAALLRKSGAL